MADPGPGTLSMVTSSRGRAVPGASVSGYSPGGKVRGGLSCRRSLNSPLAAGSARKPLRVPVCAGSPFCVFASVSRYSPGELSQPRGILPRRFVRVGTVYPSSISFWRCSCLFGISPVSAPLSPLLLRVSALSASEPPPPAAGTAPSPLVPRSMLGHGVLPAGPLTGEVRYAGNCSPCERTDSSAHELP